MSQHNSKSSSSRKSKFSSSSSSNPPSSIPDYPPSFKPQAPPSQAPHYYSKPNYPPSSNMPNYSDSHSYSKPSYDKPQQSEQMNLPNYNSMNYMAFYPPAQLMPQSNQPMAPPPRGNNPMEMQQPQYGSGFNLNQGYMFGPGYQSMYMDPNFPQQDLNGSGGMMGVPLGNKGGEGQMQVESAEPRERMEVIESHGKSESNVYQKRQRKEPEQKTSEFDVVYKKTHTENLYRQRLETLANELAKIKEAEIEIIQALINSPHPNVTSLKSRKELDSLLMLKNSIMQMPMLTPNLVVQNAIVTLPHETLKSIFAGLLPVKLKELNELEQMKKDTLAEVRRLEEGIKNGENMQQVQEDKCKVVYVNTQQFYQSEPALKELEDKLEKLDHVVREKRGKFREATKKVGETQLGLEIAKAKCQIATRRLEEMGLLNKEEGTAPVN